MGRKMKDSGVEWIGEIPEEWQICKLKYCVNHITERSENNENYIGLENVESWTGKYIESDSLQIDGTALRFNENDVLFGKLRPYLGKCIVADKKGACSTEFIVMSSYKIKSNYLKNIILTPQFIDEVNMSTYGAKMPRANWDFISNIFIPVPTKNDEEKIINIVDMINKEFITAKEKISQSIEAYKSLKQSLITHAVTKGVRGKREMTNSGIEWIGEIPVEWKLAQLGKFIAISSGISVGRTYPPGTELVEVPYLRVANVQGDYVDLTDIAFIKVTQDEADRYKLRAGSLLMTEGGDRDKLGRGTLWNGEIENCIHQNHVFEVCPNENLLVKFLDYITTSDVARIYFDITAKKTTNLACTNKSTILKFKLPIPSVEEQQEIIDYLDEKCTAIDTLIAKKEQLLTELEAYKKSLIYEYVTGKREIITNLLTMQYS